MNRVGACVCVCLTRRLKRVALTEVVRSSQRIVAGTQLFSAKDTEITCHHHTTAGPPLACFLFSTDDATRYTTYASHALEAIGHVLSTFDGLSLHNRVGLIVPDDAFRAAFLPEMQRALEPYAKTLGKRFQLVGVETACVASEADEAARNGEEWLVVDSVERFDGVELLIAITVGLDSPIDTSSTQTLQTRSRLYRGMSRAQMMALVVQEHMSNGWLAFLANPEMEKPGDFDATKEAERARKGGGVSRQLIEPLVIEQAANEAAEALAEDTGGAMTAKMVCDLFRIDAERANQEKLKLEGGAGVELLALLSVDAYNVLHCKAHTVMQTKDEPDEVATEKMVSLLADVEKCVATALGRASIDSQAQSPTKLDMFRMSALTVQMLRPLVLTYLLTHLLTYLLTYLLRCADRSDAPASGVLSRGAHHDGSKDQRLCGGQRQSWQHLWQ